MSEFYVYEYYIKETNEIFYVGKGKDNRAFKYKRNKFCEDMKKSHNWDVRIIKDNLTEEEALTYEKELIKFYRENTEYRITNQTDGGDGISGYKMPSSVKLKIAQKAKERWQDENYRNNQIFHRKYGIYQSEEYRQKMSKITKGEMNGNYNNKWNEKQKNNLSNIRKELGLAKGCNNPKAKSIMCIETGEIFDYIQLAQEKYNIKDEASFSIAIDKINRTVYGLHFITINKENKDYWLNDTNRIEYLLQCLNSTGSFSPIVCVETKEYYLTLKDLLQVLPISKTNFTKLYLKTGKKYKGFTYIYAKDYLVAYNSDIILKIM